MVLDVSLQAPLLFHAPCLPEPAVSGGVLYAPPPILRRQVGEPKVHEAVDEVAASLVMMHAWVAVDTPRRDRGLPMDAIACLTVHAPLSNE